jgi:hypothetical protein
MYNLESVRREARDFAESMTEDQEEAREFYLDIMEVVFDLELEDGKNGTRELEGLLEQHNVAWFVEEYGI